MFPRSESLTQQNIVRMGIEFVFRKMAVCALLFAPLVVSAQSEDLEKDLPFFKQQESTYQRWLDQAGLGQVLRVHGTGIDQDRLSLYLGFRYQNLDSIQAGWESLKKAFEANRPMSLERELFGKMLHFMEVPQEQAAVQLYDTYDVTRAPLFFRGIYFDGGTVKVDESDARADRKITLSPAKLGGMKKMSAATFRAKYDKAKVYSSILAYLNERYTKDPCANREPELTIYEEDNLLRFRVTDLCREVLTDAANPTLCALVDRLGYPCNWVRREKLDYTIAYQPHPDGFVLHIQVEGSYGSGRLKEVPRGAYYSMELEFKPYLEEYADKITAALGRVILYGKP
jgi:hypothetical protein